ncbi:HAD family hydrolase [Streptomyces sp. DSM 44917]|uniref:HAD family hydrolase n=1 Tax=Streptomyces boetiae TaxID=3075541 RepID=A0ABU2L399_9ACTN|nr:HAD family hydrolase [Streptomyces sp. DSM 44917]MDT0306046.1 HAD family hydrolase [Streptomyces sp. DSM 44917]
MTAPAARAASPAVVATDLDRTLIYSAAALALDMPDAEAPRLLTVETYQARPQSYVTERAAALLAELAAHEGALLVPTTTRTREQYRRVRLPGRVAPYAICANGGHLLVNGRTDEDWNASVRAALAAGCAPLAEVRDHLRRAAGPAWLLKERVAEDLFAYLVVDREAMPDAWPKELAAWAEPRGWTVSLQGRKLYAVPRPLTKSAAVAEVVRRTGAGSVLAAGDSLLDADLLLAADRAWRPGHGELAAAGWSAPHVTALAARGVRAGEEILRAFLAAVASCAAAPG